MPLSVAGSRYKGPMMELFVSHATSDAELVAEIRTRLKGLGVFVYTAEHDVRAGENVHSKIDQAIRRCHVMLVLLTKAGYDSRYVHQEVGFARRAGKLIVPLVTADVARDNLGMLEGTEYIVLDENDPFEALQPLSRRIDQLARERKSEELITAALVMVAVGVIILAMRE